MIIYEPKSQLSELIFINYVSLLLILASSDVFSVYMESNLKYYI